MTGTIITSSPAFAGAGNFGGVGAVVRAQPAAASGDQASAIAALESEGRLNLTQVGFLKVPRDVLFLQGEREAKVRLSLHGDRVASSNESEFDEERDLSRVDDHTDITPHREALKAYRRHEQPANQDAAQGHDQPAPQIPAAAAKPAPTPHGTEEFAKFVTRTDATEPAAPKAAIKTGDKIELPRKSLIGKPTGIYSTLQAVLEPFVAPDDAPQAELNVLA